MRSRCDRRSATLRAPTAADLVRLGQLAMQAQQTTLAIESFEGARTKEGPAFRHDLELGVLYLAARRFIERATRSIASRRRIRSIRWRSSSGRR